MAVNYDDERLVAVEAEKDQVLSETESMYGNMIEESDNYYNAQIDASKEWEDKQSQLQQENTDFAIEKIEQQKEQANKDYIKEQSGAYVDWQKQSNQYGVNVEQMAAQGLATGGYSESSQVSMYNTYQNRVAAARESYNKAVLNYDNAIKDAQLQNNSALAEIAYNALQQQLELSLQGFQYKNQLLETQSNKLLEIKNMYHSQYQDVLDQINTENALAEQVRQYNESLAMQKAQLEEQKRQHNESLAEQKRQFDATMSARSSSGGSSRSYSSGSSSKSSGSSYSSGSTSSTKSTAASTYSGNRGQGGSAQSSAKASTSSYAKPIYRVTNNMGNSAATQKKSNYYFSNGYQPRYIDNVKLKSTGKTVADLGKDYGVPGSQTVWVANGRCYVWDGKTREYMYVCKA